VPGFVLERQFDAPPDQVRDYLADLHNFSALHPLIESIDDLAPRPERPDARFYRVVDRISFGPFRVRTTYVASLEVVSDFEVHGDAWQRPAVRLHTVYELHPEHGGTRLVERVEVEAPWGMRRFVTTQARQAHAETLDRMQAALAPPDPPTGT
jgi:hypothetical protein